ncbi:MAG: hypothetical protein SangKO_064150 [Sandaracinaceae bacterium]
MELWRRSRWLILTALVVVGGGVALSVFGEGEIPTDPLAVAPGEARVVARVDVDALLDSAVWRLALAQEEASGARRIERTCGYDPLALVDDAVIFATGSDERPFAHVGFVARGEVARGSERRTQLVECVRAVLSDRGGAVRSVEIDGEAAMASVHGGSHAAFLGANGVVGGDRESVERAMRVHRGRAPSARADGSLAPLWSQVAAGRDVVVAAELPERWLPALRRLARGAEGDLTALAGVRALAIGLGVRDGLSVSAALRTGTAADSERLRAALQSRIDAALETPGASLTVAGRVLRRVEMRANGAELRLVAQASEDQLEGMVEMWRELQAAEASAATDAE